MPHKISIVSDIHLTLRSTLPGQNDWERDRFIELFTLLGANDSDVVVLNGDVFDKSKVTYEEVGLFYEALELLGDKEIYVTDGNHEELSDGLTTFDYLPESGFKRIKAQALHFDHVALWLVGHPHIGLIEKDLLPLQYDQKNILISHYRSDIGYAPSEVDNELVSRRFDDAVLGDIHYRLSPAHNIQYTSSPYGIHFTPDKDYGYCTITVDDGEYEIDFIKLSLPSKVKITTTKADLEDTLTSLDSANRYNIEVTGASCANSLLLLSDDAITKFNFSAIEEDIEEIVKDDLKNSGDVSISDIIMVSLDDVELTPEELIRAEKMLKEIL